MRIYEAKFKAFIINLLRRGTYKWPPRTRAFALAKLERGIYKCNMCQGTFRSKEVVADHFFPVVDPITGFVDWNTYIDRMFPEVEGFQIICAGCHDTKTEKENIIRKASKKDTKKLTRRKKSSKKKKR